MFELWIVLVAIKCTLILELCLEDIAIYRLQNRKSQTQMDSIQYIQIDPVWESTASLNWPLHKDGY